MKRMFTEGNLWTYGFGVIMFSYMFTDGNLWFCGSVLYSQMATYGFVVQFYIHRWQLMVLWFRFIFTDGNLWFCGSVLYSQRATYGFGMIAV